MKSINCMNCHRPPEVFQTDEGEDAYWMVTPNGHDDPAVLMSNLETKFCVSTDKEYPTPIDGTYFMCIKCFESINDNND